MSALIGLAKQRFSFDPAIAVCLAAAFLYHFFLNYGAFGSSGDDNAHMLAAFDLKNGPFSDFTDENARFAANQGRFFLLISGYIAYGQFLLGTPGLAIVVAALNTAIPVAAYAIGRVLFKLETRSLLWILLVCTFLIPHYKGWHGYYHFPVFFKLPLILLPVTVWCAATIFDLIRTNQNALKIAAVVLPYTLVTLVICLFWELNFILAFGLAGFTGLIKIYDDVLSGRFSPQNLVRYGLSAILIALPFLVFLLPYFLFRSQHSGRVDETLTVDLNPAEVLVTSSHLITSALPFNTRWMEELNWVGRFSRPDGFEVVLGVLLMACIALYAASRQSPAQSKPLFAMPFKADGIAAKLALPVILIAAICLAYSSTDYYQEWLSRETTYTPAFHISVVLMAALGYGAYRLSRLSPVIGYVVMGALFIAGFANIWLNSIATQMIKRSSQPAYAVAQAIDEFQSLRPDGPFLLINAGTNGQKPVPLERAVTDSIADRAKLRAGDVTHIRATELTCALVPCGGPVEKPAMVTTLLSWPGKDGAYGILYAPVERWNTSAVPVGTIGYLIDAKAQYGWAVFANTEDGRLIEARIKVNTPYNGDVSQATFPEPVYLSSIRVMMKP